ncbi:MAG: double zinc ribbon domain-containing protein, partial [Promethearchaeota archaeon]
GAIIDMSSGIEYCPSCGGRLSLPEIKIDLSSRSNSTGLNIQRTNCPHCKKEIQDSTSLFCPYCGSSIETLVESKVSRSTLTRIF